MPAFLAALTTGYNINVATTTLDSANARTFSSFTRGGGMGLPEMTGSPNLTIVPDPATFRVLPLGARRRLDPVRRVFQLRRAVSFLAAASACASSLRRLAERGWTLVVGLEVEWYLMRVAQEQLNDDNIGAPGMRGVPVKTAPIEPGYSLPFRIQHGPDAAGALGAGGGVRDDRPAAALDRERVGAGAGGVHLRGARCARSRRQPRAVPHRHQADRAAAWAASPPSCAGPG